MARSALSLKIWVAFAFLWLSQFISALGDALAIKALMYLLNEQLIEQGMDPSTLDYRQNISSMRALFQMMEFLPFMLCAPLAGWLVDRFDQKKLMIVTDIVRAIFALSLLAAGAFNINWVMIPLLALGLMTCIFSPAKVALLPQVVGQDRLPLAIACLAMAGILAHAFGQQLGAMLLDPEGLGGFLLTWAASFGFIENLYQVAVWGDALTFVVSAGCVMMVKRHAPDQSANQDKSSSQDLWRGFKVLSSNRYLWPVLVMVALVWSTASIMGISMDAFALNFIGDDIENLPSKQAALSADLISTMGLGLIGGVIFIGLFGREFRITTSYSLSLSGLSVFYWGLRTSPPDWSQALFMAAGFGVMCGTVIGRLNADKINLTQPEERGRVLAAINVVFGLAMIVPSCLVLIVPIWWPNHDVTDTMANSSLVVIFVSLCFWFSLWRRHGTAGLFADLMLSVVRVIDRFLCYFAVRASFHGLGHFPRRGPYIVAANHCSYIDPILVQLAAPGPVGFYMDLDFYEKAPWFFGPLGHMPVNEKGGNSSVLREGLNRLEANKVIGIFPEGRLSLDGHMQSFQAGVGLLARKAGVPVVPIWLDNTINVWKKGEKRPHWAKRVRVQVGEALKPQDGESNQAFVERVRQAILALQPKEQPDL